MNKIYQTQIIQNLISENQYLKYEYVIPIIRLIGNFIFISDEYLDIMIKLGCIPIMENLLKDSCLQVRKESCWAISNITSGTKEHLSNIIKNTKIISLLVDILRNENNYFLKKEAMYAITNACVNALEFELYVDLVKDKVLDVLNDNLNLKTDPFFIDSSMSALKSILKSGEIIKKVNKVNPFAKKFEEIGGVSRLEQFQKYHNTTIYEKAVILIEMFFNRNRGNDIFGY